MINPFNPGIVVKWLIIGVLVALALTLTYIGATSFIGKNGALRSEIKALSVRIDSVEGKIRARDVSVLKDSVRIDRLESANGVLISEKEGLEESINAIKIRNEKTIVDFRHLNASGKRGVFANFVPDSLK